MRSAWAAHRAQSSGSACFAAALVAMAVCRAAHAQDLRGGTSANLAVTLGGAGAWITSEDLRDKLVPPHCRWCDRDNSGHDTLNPIDRAGRRLRWRRTAVANVLSDISAFALTPLASIGSVAGVAARDARGHETGSDALVVAEAGVLAADLNQVVKFMAVRERPDAHALALANPGAPPRTPGDDLSFCSGHTTVAMSLAVAAGTVASLHGYRWAPVVWGTTVPLAAITGYLRVGADRHYLTDVLIGAALGAGVGLLVPYALRGSEAAPDPMGPMSGAHYMLALSGVW
jgi:membrane-associated phospholipid phosphatase